MDNTNFLLVVRTIAIYILGANQYSDGARCLKVGRYRKNRTYVPEAFHGHRREFGGESGVFPSPKKWIWDSQRCNFKLKSIVQSHFHI